MEIGKTVNNPSPVIGKFLTILHMRGDFKGHLTIREYFAACEESVRTEREYFGDHRWDAVHGDEGGGGSYKDGGQVVPHQPLKHNKGKNKSRARMVSSHIRN